MDPTITVALISGVGTVIGSLLGILASQQLTKHRLEQLEKKVDKHNNTIERTFKLEGQVAELQHDVRDLKAYHKPT